MVKRERHVVNGKVPQHAQFHFLLVSSKILVFRRIILKCDNEPNTKVLQDEVIHACVGVEVILQGPPEGDHMANGRAEMAVREVKRQCGTLRISAEQNTNVRIEDDSPLLSWLPRFAAQVMNNMRIGKDGKTSEMRRTGDGVETLGVDSRTRVKRLGAKDKARRKKCKVRFSIMKKNKAFRRNYMRVGREVATCRHDTSKDVVGACSRNASYGKV